MASSSKHSAKFDKLPSHAIAHFLGSTNAVAFASTRRSTVGADFAHKRLAATHAPKHGPPVRPVEVFICRGVELAYGMTSVDDAGDRVIYVLRPLTNGSPFFERFIESEDIGSLLHRVSPVTPHLLLHAMEHMKQMLKKGQLPKQVFADDVVQTDNDARVTIRAMIAAIIAQLADVRVRTARPPGMPRSRNNSRNSSK